uniref:Uncharacterized protein n=1 Tax=Anguilla anguilla TaxID=7936 RepID=A0A0E9SPK8_ANGAN
MWASKLTLDKYAASLAS